MSELGNHAPSLEAVTNQFQTDIGLVSAETTYPLPNLSDQINHNAKYVQVHTPLEPGIYLDDSLQLPDVTYGFFAQNANRLTREDSHNTVFFGSLLLLPEGNSEEVHAQVAIKSRPSHELSKLTGELALFQRIGALGLKTFKPAGLVVTDQAAHLMTHFEGNITTMDAIDWLDIEPEEMWLELHKAVDTMQQLHTNMLFHGDLEFRNVAFDHTGETAIIDPELMISGRELFEELEGAGMILNDRQQRAFDALTRKLSVEFSAVCKSIDSQIVPLLPKQDRPRTDEARLKLYKQHLFEPYKSRLRESDEPINAMLLRLCDAVLLRKKELAKKQTL